MSIICRHRPEVKPTRRTERRPGRFGAGLLATRPAYRAPFSVADAAWHALSLATLEDARVDAMAGEAEGQRLVDAGLCL